MARRRTFLRAKVVFDMAQVWYIYAFRGACEQCSTTTLFTKPESAEHVGHIIDSRTLRQFDASDQRERPLKTRLYRKTEMSPSFLRRVGRGQNTFSGGKLTLSDRNVYLRSFDQIQIEFRQNDSIIIWYFHSCCNKHKAYKSPKLLSLNKSKGKFSEIS